MYVTWGFKMTDAVKKCQFCGEEILAVAIKCKHCNSDLTGNAAISTESKPIADYGTFLLGIPALATMLIIFWVGSMNLLQSPSSALGLIMVGTILGTATLAAMEASKVGMVSDKAKGTYSPTAWFFIIALLWVVGYPVYLYKRKHYGLKNRLTLGLVVMFIFIICYSAMSSAVEKKKAEVLGGLQSLSQ
jgi:hypothetical protein